MKYILIIGVGRDAWSTGPFDTIEAAKAWAKADGWEPELYKVVKFYP